MTHRKRRLSEAARAILSDLSGGLPLPEALLPLMDTEAARTWARRGICPSCGGPMLNVCPHRPLERICGKPACPMVVYDPTSEIAG